MDISPIVDKFYQDLSLKMDSSPLGLKKPFNFEGKLKVNVEKEIKDKIFLSKVFFFADSECYYIVNQKTKKLLFVDLLKKRDPRIAIREEVLDRGLYLNTFLLIANNGGEQVKELLNSKEVVLELLNQIQTIKKPL